MIGLNVIDVKVLLYFFLDGKHFLSRNKQFQDIFGTFVKFIVVWKQN